MSEINDTFLQHLSYLETNQRLGRIVIDEAHELITSWVPSLSFSSHDPYVCLFLPLFPSSFPLSLIFSFSRFFLLLKSTFLFIISQSLPFSTQNLPRNSEGNIWRSSFSSGCLARLLSSSLPLPFHLLMKDV